MWVSHTALIHFQLNRYSVPTAHVNVVLRLCIYPEELVLVAEGSLDVARHRRSFEREQTYYDWQHYIDLLQINVVRLAQRHVVSRHARRAPGAATTLATPPGGDRVMAQVLAAVPIHGLEAVLVAVELALDAGRPSAEHMLNLLPRLNQARYLDPGTARQPDAGAA